VTGYVGCSGGVGGGLLRKGVRKRSGKDTEGITAEGEQLIREEYSWRA